MNDLNNSRNLAVRPRAGCSHLVFLLPVLIMVGTGLMMLAGQVTAQTFTTLYSFTATSGPNGYGSIGTNSDGAFPNDLLLTNNTLYGTTESGGSSGYGAVFKINTDGTGFATLYSFTTTSGPSNTNSDGASPQAGLILSGNTLFGTAYEGGSGNGGTVFAVDTDGTGFTNLHDFTTAPTEPVDRRIDFIEQHPVWDRRIWWQ